MAAVNVGVYQPLYRDPMVDPIVAGLANTAASSFGRVYLCRVEGSRNVILFMRRGEGMRGRIDVSGLTEEARPYPELMSLAQYVEHPGNTWERVFDPTGTVFTDDLCPIEEWSDEQLMVWVSKQLEGASR